MKLSKLALLAAICCGGSVAATVTAQSPYLSTPVGAGVAQVGHCEACNAPACGCESMMPSCGCEGSCDGGCASSSDWEMACDSGCSDCGGILDGDGCCECDLGDPFTLLGNCGSFKMGGWLQLGYHNKANTLFNSRADEFQVHQTWIYAEKEIDMDRGGIGGRIDYIYGTDSQDTQAFGTDPRGWDNDWDNGPDYGHALPQAYLEAGYGNGSIKVGHFYTIIGWEVVTAPDNFFYSHAYTMYNSEPFTHTGALLTYNIGDHITAWGGYTFGWDSGFDDNGDSFLGGVSLGLTDDVTLIYTAIGGRFGESRFPNGNGDERGYMQSIVADVTLTESLQYIFQSDLLDSENVDGVAVRDTFGINQYLIYSFSDCFAVGARGEWYQNEGVYTDVGQNADIYELTLGLNYRPHANLIVRPEIRWDWVDNNTAVLAAGNTVTEDGDDDQTTFGIDTIIQF